MLFSIIYSFDCAPAVSVRQFQPPCVRRWELTENSGSDLTDDEGFKGWKHRKYCAVLTRQQFEQFLDDTNVVFEARTLGSIGAPGFGYGWTPAVAFGYSDECCLLSAYVTPVPARVHKRNEPIDDQAWKRLETALIGFYHRGTPASSRLRRAA